ncbi:MAG: hypothetical protein ACK4PI_13995 [Tepidisphaerales bacterium]
MRSLALVSAVAATVLAAPAFASTPVIDGTAEALYGAPLVVQGVQTGFGDANLGQPLFANGSELNAAFGLVSNGKLFLTFAGNLESNFNKLEVFFDTIAGGQNKLRGDNADVDFNGLNRMGDDGSGNGLRFDDGFEADFYLTVTGGDVGGGTYRLFSNFATLPTGGNGVGTFLGGSDPNTGLLVGALGITIAIDNSNTAGVGFGSGAASGAGVNTGIEIEIPLALIGSPTGNFRITAFINGQGHDFLSNQVLAPIPPDNFNLGEPRNVNFADIPGDQFFTIVQGPSFILGDFNFDGIFDSDDIDPFLEALLEDTPYANFIAAYGSLFTAQYGGTLTPELVVAFGDFDSNSIFDAEDVDLFVSAVLSARPGASSIPEPAMLGLLAPAALLLSRRRR